MTNQEKLQIILQKVNEVSELISDCDYHDYLNLHLTFVRIELERQLNLLTKSTIHSKIKESN